MKTLKFGAILAVTVALTGCSMTKQGGSNQPNNSTAQQQQTQQEARNKAAFDKAASLTSGWPEVSNTAAREMIEKHGDPQEVTSDSLIWRNVAPFKKIVVHKVTYNHRFPLMHQNALEHVVEYKAPANKVAQIWKYNGSIVLDRTKGEMSSFADNEAMNILALNLAHDIMTGKRGTENARMTYGKETINYLNGNKTAFTQVLTFGGQYETADAGESIANKIRWQGDQRAPAATPRQNLNTRQAQEAKKSN